MKQIITNYSFSASAKTVTLTDFSGSHPVALERLLLIIDVTTNQILYNFADNTVAAASISSNNVVTLSALPSGPANSDKLQITYDVVIGDPTYQTPLLPSNAAQESGGNLASIATNTSAAATNTSTIAGAISGGKMNVNLASGSGTIGSVDITDGTNTANVVAGDTGFNGVATASGSKTYTFSTTATGAQTLLANTSCEGFSTITIITTSTGTALSWNGQFAANSGGTYVNGVTWAEVSNGNSLPVTLQAVNDNIQQSPVQGNFFQLAISAMTGGTTSGYVILSNTPSSIFSIRSTPYSQANWGIGATGSSVPANAVLAGAGGGGGALVGLKIDGGVNDGSSGTLAVGPYTYNGSAYYHMRDATTASGTTGTGLLGSGLLAQYNSAAPTVSSGNYNVLQLDSSANLKVNLAATSGSGLTVQPGNTPNTSPWLMSLQPATAGGWSTYSSASITNTVVSVKSSAGQLGGYRLYNPNASVEYVQVFNLATGSVALGTTTPTYFFSIPPGATANVEFANGIAHSTAISIAATTTATGSTAPGTALAGFILYK